MTATERPIIVQVAAQPAMEQPDPGNVGNSAQISYWNDRAAVTWTAYQERIDAVFVPLTAIALHAAAPLPGERVIDVGCGCGTTTLELAQQVGSAGHVLGLDVSEPMSARARERIAAQGANNAAVLVSDAATHAFPVGETDLLFSRFGVMFFADPVAAFINLRRAMRPGGRLLCVAWRPLSENPWFAVPLEAAQPLFLPQAPSDPDAPGPFAFADAERVCAILTAAGWREPELRAKAVPMRLAGQGQIDEATAFITRIGPLAGLMAAADPDLRKRARLAVSKVLRNFDGPDGISLPGSIWLLSAQA